MEKPMDNHNKHYYEKDRNIDQYGGKTRSGGIMSDSRVPDYYKGKEVMKQEKFVITLIFLIISQLPPLTSYGAITSMTLQ